MHVLMVFVYYGGQPLGVFTVLHACEEGFIFKPNFGLIGYLMK